MKDIGILTFSRAINYGALLQAYALKTVFSEHTDTELIHYKSPYMERMYHAFPPSPRALAHALAFAKRDRRFRAFMDEINSPDIYTEKTVMGAPYARLVVGSDQVWNTACTGGDLVFLPLGMPQERVYSYAASFGLPRLPEGELPLFRRALSRMRVLSVREESGKRICRDQLGLDAETAIDPTLLLPAEHWRTFAKGAAGERKKGGYVLLYSIVNGARVRAAATAVSHALGLPLCNLTVSMTDRLGECRVRDAGPREFVSLLAGADFVVTDSFHGTAFALNLGVPFYAFAEDARASRITDLLALVGLSARCNPTAEEIKAPTRIDFTGAHRLLADERERSLKIIEKIAEDGKQK